MRSLVALLTVSLLTIATVAEAQLSRRVYASGFALPVGFVQDPVDPTVQYVVEQGGRIRVLKSGVLQATDFLTLTQGPGGDVTAGGEDGLLGLAFAPDYATSGRFYVNFTNVVPGRNFGDTVVARFKRSAANPLVADHSTRFDLRWSTGLRVIEQPFANHNGGNLMFGPDGFLYIGMGDGGNGNDPLNNAQTMSTLLGKILRIDVNVPDTDTNGFRVPADNPFLGTPGARPEIWDVGMRNPWRFSFDDPARGGTGALIIGDVGQGAIEEVDYEPAGQGGRNYGWNIREGAHPTPGVDPTTSPTAFLPFTDPIYEYTHATGVSVTGGFVYRGTRLGSGFRGRYVFADLNGRVFSLGLSIDGTTGAAQVTDVREHTAELGSAVNITSFGVDAAGELYYTDYGGGRIMTIDPAAPAAPAITANPSNMSRIAGQLVSLSASASGVPVPSVQWQVSSDRGATWIGIPGGTTPTITFRTAAADSGRLFRAVFSNTAGSAASAPAQLTIRPAPAGDIDDDFKTDLVVWRPSSGTWFTLTSGSNYAPASARATTWGGATGDQPLLGDLDGDGVGDFVIWNSTTGTWSWLTSLTGYATGSAGSKQWGNASLGDRPMLGDIDGDGKGDLIVWRASTGTWFWLLSSAGYAYSAAGGVQWGNNSLGDVPLLGDFDGDGRADPAVWRASTGTWFWLRSTRGYASNAALSRQWGNQALGDMPIIGDIDGDGRTELTVWRASTGTWFWLASSTQYAAAPSVQWGNQAAGDRPLLGDFDGDGRSDVAVWRASTGTWFWLSSSSSFANGAARSRQWGSPTDVPVVK